MSTRQVYARELAANGGNTEAAAEAARSDFFAKFGNDKFAGEYALNTGADGAANAFKYKNYTTDGVLSQATDPMVQIREKTQGPFGGANEALAEPDLYAGEENLKRCENLC